ncbi:universal stress protein [Streptomyces sp. NPDC001414]
MSRTVTVGIDDSPESRAAAGWAAREALLRGLPLKIVHVQEPTPRYMARGPLPGLDGYRHRAQRLTRETAESIRRRHPGIEVNTGMLTGTVADVLCEAAGFTELLVLGSRGLGRFGAFTVGAVSPGVVACAERPVVLVRAGKPPADEDAADSWDLSSSEAPGRPVVLGLDIDRPDERVLEFAFDAAARRKAALRAVHAWSEPPPSFSRRADDAEFHGTLERGQASLLSKVLRPWRQRFPDVDVIEVSRCGCAPRILADDCRGAALLVVGRRVRTGGFGPRIGPVTQSALHHISAPVAVVAHG